VPPAFDFDVQPAMNDQCDRDADSGAGGDLPQRGRRCSPAFAPAARPASFERRFASVLRPVATKEALYLAAVRGAELVLERIAASESGIGEGHDQVVEKFATAPAAAAITLSPVVGSAREQGTPLCWVAGAPEKCVAETFFLTSPYRMSPCHPKAATEDLAVMEEMSVPVLPKKTSRPCPGSPVPRVLARHREKTFVVGQDGVLRAGCVPALF
jgi:hypothetical protein